MEKVKILELTNFSSGICGVWNRVFEESKRLAKNYEVRVFSSYFTKGSDEIAPRYEEKEGVKILRFPAKRLGGESFMRWDFEREAIRYKPDIIIAHSYRHLHTEKALKVARKIGAKVFLVTHGPFVENDMTRSFFSKWAVRAYDAIVGPTKINKFDKVLIITPWEVPYLERIGINRRRIEYVPNGIPIEFFREKKKVKEEYKILFLGRISPIKDLETLIVAMSLLKDKKVTLEIVGPAEEEYINKLKGLVKKRGMKKRINFTGPIYDLKDKIKKIDSAKIFVLPSKREAMPQSLIEAKAREKIMIGSNNPGCAALIEDGKDGYLFEIGNPIDLAEKLDFALSSNVKEIKKAAKKSVEKFAWNKIMKKIEKIIS